MNLADVQLAVPTRDRIHYGTVEALQDLRDRHPELPPVLYQASRHSVIVTRNLIRQRFLASDARVLVMVDDDVEFHPDFLDALPMLDRFGILGCPVPVAGPLRMHLNYALHPGDELPAAFHVGAACMAIRRDVAGDVGFREVELIAGLDYPESFYPSEDFLYCWDARTRGYEIGVDLEHMANHLDMHYVTGFDLLQREIGARYGEGLPLSLPPNIEQLVSARTSRA